MSETDTEFVERFFSEAQERGWLVGQDRHRLRDIARRGARKINQLLAGQEPLGAEFEKVWEDNAASLYESEQEKPE